MTSRRNGNAKAKREAEDATNNGTDFPPAGPTDGAENKRHQDVIECRHMSGREPC